MKVCARSWGSPGTGWTFCVLAKGHAGECAGYAGPKPAWVLYFEEQPEALAEIIAAELAERKAIARKEAKKSLLPAE